MTPKRLLARAGAFMLLLMVVAQSVFAQGKTVTGKVTDSKDGSPVQNASITIKGTSKGTTTDQAGNFRIAIENSNAVLVISSVGFATREVAVGDQSALTITLVSTQSTLNEVVVVGYGTTRKRDLTGAVATISAKDFVKGAVQSPEQLIAGKIAGVQIIPSGGAAGSGSQIRIRGGASLNASNDPLVVIDGVPVDNGNAMNLLNPNDIESYTLLKDPSAAAIYGSRASNGVLIITTKKGKKGKVVYNFSAQGYLQQPVKQVDVLTADELKNVITTKLPSLSSYIGKTNTNWQDEIYHVAFGQDYNLSASGAVADGKLPFRLSGGFMNQDGILKTDNFKRLTGTLNLSPRFFNDRLKVDLNVKLSGTRSSDVDWGAIGNAVSFDPTQAIYTNSNRYGGYFEWLESDGSPASNANKNPLALLYLRDHQSNSFRSISNIQFDYSFPFVKGLRANLNFGHEFSDSRGIYKKTDSAAASYNKSNPALGGYSNSTYLERHNWLYDVYLNYVKEFRSISSRIDFTVGHGMQKFGYYNYNNPSYSYSGLLQGSYPLLISSNSDDVNGDNGYAMISYYGRLNYTLAGKYVFTVNAREDGSSRFSKNNRWGFFPSAAFAWRISEEDFLKNSKVISDLKFRVGYGVTGQQDIPRLYGYIPVYDQSNAQGYYQLGNTFYTRLGPVAYDPDLRWETTENLNAAIEFGLLNNRITGILEGFSRKTKDLIVDNVSIPLGSNFADKILTNVGNIESTGFEVTLNFVPVKTKNIEWEIGGNFTYANPKVTKLFPNANEDATGRYRSDVVIPGSINKYIQYDAIGYRPSMWYVYKQVYDQNGKPIEGLYEDKNRDGAITDADRYLFKPSQAPMYLGINSSFRYKKFTAGIGMRGSIGNYNYNAVAMQLGVLNQIKIGTGIQNAHRSYLETGFVTKQELSDYYIQNASFLRLENINFGYDAGEVLWKKTSLRINANIQNVFTITKYKGINPEIQNGLDGQIYPRPRTYVLGVNLDF